MKFNGVQCVYCNNVFTENDDVVVCPECGSPHHRSCWKEKGECANAHLHEDGFSWEFPENLKPREEKKPDPKAATPTNFQFKNGENAVVCAHCGSINYGNDALCIKCRKPLNGESKDVPYDERPERYLDEEDMQDYYERFGGLRPDILIEGIPASEYADYIGENKAGAYLRKFAAMERFGKKISVSICALLFGYMWFLYRKMFKEGLIYFLIIMLLTGIQAWCSITEPIKEFYTATSDLYTQVINGEITLEEFTAKLEEYQQKTMIPELSKTDKVKSVIGQIASTVSLVLCLTAAFFATYLYKRKVQADIMKIRTECSDMHTYRRTLHERGGVSVGGVVIGILLAGVVYFITMLPAYIVMFNSFKTFF